MNSWHFYSSAIQVQAYRCNSSASQIHSLLRNSFAGPLSAFLCVSPADLVCTMQFHCLAIQCISIAIRNVSFPKPFHSFLFPASPLHFNSSPSCRSPYCSSAVIIFLISESQFGSYILDTLQVRTILCHRISRTSFSIPYRILS